MQAPNTRAEFERNFHLLHRKLELQQISSASHLMHTLEGLEHVRRLPNGRVDFLSVDESARLQANMMANMEKMPPPDPAAPESGNAEPDTGKAEVKPE